LSILRLCHSRYQRREMIVFIVTNLALTGIE